MIDEPAVIIIFVVVFLPHIVLMSLNAKILIAVVVIIIIAVIAYFMLKKDKSPAAITIPSGGGGGDTNILSKKEVYCCVGQISWRDVDALASKFNASVATYAQVLDAVKKGGIFGIWSWFDPTGSMVKAEASKYLAISTSLNEKGVDVVLPPSDSKYVSVVTAGGGTWSTHTLLYGVKPDRWHKCSSSLAPGCILPFNSTKWSQYS